MSATAITTAPTRGADLRGIEPLREAMDASRTPGAITREYLASIRAELRARHDRGAGGTEIVAAMTTAMDDLIRALFLHAENEHARRSHKLNQRVSIVARGGYGRGELNPYSDIDLLFLHDYKRGPYLEFVTEIILHAMWDAGLVLGYGVRTPRESIKLANEDLKEKTAIIDARPLCGDEKLFREFDKLLNSEVFNRNQDKFFKAKLEESRERHAKYGDSIYLLEPHLKDGEGGLRDLHTALWLAKVKYKIHAVEELVPKAVITEPELRAVVEARDFMFRVRNALHFLTGRHFDQLTFEMQERIEPTFAMAPEAGQATGSALMRAYYQHATTIDRFAKGLIARVTENSPGGRFFRRTPTRKIRAGVVVQQDLLAISDPKLLRRDPINLITVYEDCQAQGVGLSGSAFQLIRDNLELIDDSMRAEPRVAQALMRILSARARVAETLEAMHLSGVLGAIIPEFGNLYARVLHDLYHIYTVDRHSLVAVKELEKLRSGAFKTATPLLTEVARELDCMPLVFLSLLLHDIGKGHGHDHHERGATLTVDVCKRLGLDPEAIDLVVVLVRNHLMMSEIAQKGDLDDHVTVSGFAYEVGSIERLKALYLLTYADMRAVAPNVYNNWRDMLLSDLYLRALKILEQGDREAVDPARRLSIAKAAVRKDLAERGADSVEVDSFLAGMPDRYFFITPHPDVLLHFDLMRSLGDRAMVSRVRHFPDLEYSEYIVVTRDQPGLFSMIAGALTANNLNILSARIITRDNGIAIDAFRVSHHDAVGLVALEDERWTFVSRDLESAITGERNIADLVAAAHHVRTAAKKFQRRVQTEVTVDNRTSEEFTVIDVFTQDRVGLLFAITHTLFEMGLSIHLARISTNADQALDVFYVSDRNGEKITDLERMRTLRATLEERLQGTAPTPAEATA